MTHTNSVSSNNKILNTFRLCVTGSTQGGYPPHKRAIHVSEMKHIYCNTEIRPTRKENKNKQVYNSMKLKTQFKKNKYI